MKFGFQVGDVARGWWKNWEAQTNNNALVKGCCRKKQVFLVYLRYNSVREHRILKNLVSIPHNEGGIMKVRVLSSPDIKKFKYETPGFLFNTRLGKGLILELRFGDLGRKLSNF